MLPKITMLAAAVFLASCSHRPSSFQNMPQPNPKAPLAWFGEGSANKKMQMQYAEAMQRAGIFNFVAEDFSDEQIENAVEIRMNYTEESHKFNKIPVMRLQTEIVEEGTVTFRFTLVEESHAIAADYRARNREKLFRQNVLLHRFLEELKRLKSEENNLSCKG